MEEIYLMLWQYIWKLAIRISLKINKNSNRWRYNYERHEINNIKNGKIIYWSEQHKQIDVIISKFHQEYSYHIKQNKKRDEKNERVG